MPVVSWPRLFLWFMTPSSIGYKRCLDVRSSSRHRERGTVVENVEQLVADHGEAVMRFLRRRVGPDLCDLVYAEVFVTAWRRLGEIPVGFERAWLYGTCRRVIANQMRAQRRQSSLVGKLIRIQPRRWTGQSTLPTINGGARARGAEHASTAAPV